ncbi:nuclear transport factor 2 family protein [Sphingomonas sp. QA11]|uniref:nuclear transport factor 2 family protein n=1 Tax=Sphingomonas sp. QA11 TaxID=2950605 RepID=UPI00234B3726|nr:nuclear transport factor 2 family protein [Sphingomonas sp. QA11]WCM25475.1 nuclear transport factor 2 family protein [Sphingomonas sp. QA11]
MNDSADDDIRTVLTRYASAWCAGDLQAITSCYHDDFTLHYFGTSPLAGVHRGKGAALTALADFSRRSRRRLIEISDIAVGAKRGVILAREEISIGGRAVEIERTLIYTVRDSLLFECWVLDEDQRLIDEMLQEG